MEEYKTRTDEIDKDKCTTKLRRIKAILEDDDLVMLKYIE
jgi:hypothetical protein